jgi:alkylation response protein AidB-like acyl-CoA dehydrogenase
MMEPKTKAIHADAGSLLERLDALRELIESSADANEEATKLSDEVLDALEQVELFKIMAPRAVGGMEAHPLLVIDALRKLSCFDGSTGWYCQAAVTGPAVAGAFLGDRAIDEIFCSGGRATCAGQAAPSGKAERVGDGYRISGSFSFGSGTPNASWIVGGYILHENGVPVLRENGQPIMLIAMAPRSKVEFLGNWNVLGLRGTGSYDFRVLDQIIHRDFAFDAANPEQKRGGALYAMGFMAIPCLSHSGFALGCTRRALDEWVDYARTKKRIPKGTVSEMETYQKELAIAHAHWRSADAYVRNTFKDLYSSAERGNVSEELKLDTRLCASNALKVGMQISQLALTSSATTGLRNGSKIQRCFRDMQAGNAHVMTGEQSFIGAGRYLAGIDRTAFPGF